MNNQVSKLLEVNFPDPQHSNFNLGRKNVFSADVGYLYPCYVEEVLADSFKSLDLEALVQCNATVAPVLGSFTCKVEAYFVPIRIYHQHLINNDRAIDFTDDFDFHYFPWLDVSSQVGLVHQRPVVGSAVQYSSLIVSSTSLLNYLGMFPTGWNASSWSAMAPAVRPKINGYPFIGYFDIYRNYYANPYDEDIPFRVSNYLNSSEIQDNYVVDVSDATIKLSVFDTFVNQIRENSITYVNGVYHPQVVDVFSAFNRNFKFSRGDSEITVPLFQNQLGFLRSGSALDNSLSTANGMHFGLLRRTYKDDYFNARMSTDFVEYLRSQSRVVVNNNGLNTGFDITQLRLANRIAKYVDKLGFSDSRFGTWLKVHFGTKLNDRADIPQFLGSISSTLTFDDIVSQAQTGNSDVVSANEALGSRAGIGAGYIKNDGAFVEFKAVEPGYLMCLFSIVPNVVYSQGIRKMFLKTRFSDLYTPEFDAVGYQDLHAVEMSAVGYSLPADANTSINGPLDYSVYNEVVGKHPSWIEYMTSIDEAHGLMTERNQYGYWTLLRPFDANAYNFGASGQGSAPTWDRSTYIRPEYFNNIFAVNKLTDNFQVQIRFKDRTSQPMSKQVLPRL